MIAKILQNLTATICQLLPQGRREVKAAFAYPTSSYDVLKSTFSNPNAEFRIKVSN